MKQRELLEAVAGVLKSLTGNDYAIDYSPHRNVSEQPSGSVYRCVTPGTLRKEATTRGQLLTYQEVTVCHFAIIPDYCDALIIENQEEAEEILATFMSRSAPVVISSADGVEATVKAAESQPYADDGVIKSGLEKTPRELIAAVSITFLIC